MQITNLSKGVTSEVYPKDIAFMFSNYNLEIDDDRIEWMYQQEVHETLKVSRYMSLWQLMAVSSILGMKIFSVYPQLGPDETRRKLHCIIHPSIQQCDLTAYIMWCSLRTDMNAEHWVTNHFSLMLPLIEPHGSR